jgi:hypothetical protein
MQNITLDNNFLGEVCDRQVAKAQKTRGTVRAQPKQTLLYNRV